MGVNLSPQTVLIAGIGGASLGTEVAKALRRDPIFRIIGADISPTAYGHYDRVFDATHLADQKNYVASILAICTREDVRAIIPGGERPMALLAAAQSDFESAGIVLAMNDVDLAAQMSDKASCFAKLEKLGFAVPQTTSIRTRGDLAHVQMPAIIKPAKDSGGSTGVYFATTLDEAWLQAKTLIKAGRLAIAQQYVPHHEGEFTVGVLSLPSGRTLGSIALRRAFDNKLSVADSGPKYLISSGYSQGIIDEFPEVCAVAQNIAEAVGSRGPLNVQGRMANGIFYPFEINPRFSATTYLRAMAGFNEVALFLRHVLLGEAIAKPHVLPGWYLRSFVEVHVPVNELRS
jgi:carbamoyl-phosphate synthase large subunit